MRCIAARVREDVFVEDEFSDSGIFGIFLFWMNSFLFSKNSTKNNYSRK